MRFWTLEQLRAAARTESGLRGDKAFRDSDWLTFINRAIGQIWTQLTADEMSGYGLVDTTVTATPGQSDIALPADHLRTLQLNRPQSGTNQQYAAADLTTRGYILDRYPETDGEDITKPGVYWYLPVSLYVRPTPTVAEVLKILYVKTAPVLVNDTDTIDTIAGFEEALICFAAGYATQDPGRRAQLLSRAEQHMEIKVATWGNRRDKGPHYLTQYSKRGRRNRW